MLCNHPGRTVGSRRTAFSLVELLTVMFVISLLIAILIPSVTRARTAAKNLKTRAFIRALESGLESFKSEQGSSFAATNGYPPSFSHPKIEGYSFDPTKGEFPFTIGDKKPVAYGAQWLPAMLLGADGLGYVAKSAVPPAKKDKPYQWYDTDTAINPTPIPRSSLYVSAEAKSIKKGKDLPGQPSDTTFKNSAAGELPVFVDAFDQAILYYASNKYGRPTKLVGGANAHQNASGDTLPAYFHEDNAVFTGLSQAGTPVSGQLGWNYLGTNLPGTSMLHMISDPGDTLDATELTLEEVQKTPVNGTTFAYYILDRGALSLVESPKASTHLRAVRPDSFLLISAGPDGRYGTPDDVTNLPERDD